MKLKIFIFIIAMCESIFCFSFFGKKKENINNSEKEKLSDKKGPKGNGKKDESGKKWYERIKEKRNLEKDKNKLKKKEKSLKKEEKIKRKDEIKENPKIYKPNKKDDIVIGRKDRKDKRK